MIDKQWEYKYIVYIIDIKFKNEIQTIIVYHIDVIQYPKFADIPRHIKGTSKYRQSTFKYIPEYNICRIYSLWLSNNL